MMAKGRCSNREDIALQQTPNAKINLKTKSRKSPAKTPQAVSQGALPFFPDVPQTSFKKEHRPPLTNLSSYIPTRPAPMNSTVNSKDAVNVEVIIPEINLFCNAQNIELENVAEIDDDEINMDFDLYYEFASQNFRNGNVTTNSLASAVS